LFFNNNDNDIIIVIWKVEPISKTDIEVSKYLTLSKKPIFHVYAIRTININTEVKKNKKKIKNKIKLNIYTLQFIHVIPTFFIQFFI